MLTDNEDIISRDSRMVNVINEGRTTDFSLTERKLEATLIENVAKKHDRILDHIDKCMMNLKVNNE